MQALSIIPSHDVAYWLLGMIDHVLDLLGLSRYRTVEEVIYFVIILAASIGIGWLLRRLILGLTQKFVRLQNSDLGQDILHQRTLTKCSHVIPPLVFLALVPFAFESSAAIHRIVMTVAIVYTLLMVGKGINAIFRLVYSRYDKKENTKNLPLKGILNVAMGIVWAVVLILSISVIVQKSPAALLGGLTAFAAVLMLIFKDSILGFVSGIQMSENDMVRVGDWIVVPSTLANGTVIDVSLTTVKVRNFDNTIVTVPPYTLVSGSFQNWRGMSESGVRRISQSIYINPDSVCAPDDAMIASICDRYPEVKKFVDSLRDSGKTVAWDKGTSPLNGTIETNLGLFRAYMVTYLLASDMVDHNGTDLMLSIQPMSAEGIPLQIYCFAVTTQWEAYEGIRSAIMEHAVMAAPTFGLEILSADHVSVDTRVKDVAPANQSKQ